MTSKAFFLTTFDESGVEKLEQHLEKKKRIFGELTEGFLIPYVLHLSKHSRFSFSLIQPAQKHYVGGGFVAGADVVGEPVAGCSVDNSGALVGACEV